VPCTILENSMGKAMYMTSFPISWIMPATKNSLLLALKSFAIIFAARPHKKECSQKLLIPNESVSLRFLKLLKTAFARTRFLISVKPRTVNACGKELIFLVKPKNAELAILSIVAVRDWSGLMTLIRSPAELSELAVTSMTRVTTVGNVGKESILADRAELLSLAILPPLLVN
jgi:hypothetical protein